MNKTERQTLMRSRFADRHGLTLTQVSKLCGLAHARHSAEEKAISYDVPGLEEASDRATERFEKAAAALGFETDWNGLWPTLRKDGQDIHLPE